MNTTANDALFQFLLRLGDNTLILSHRVSEWCGHAPVIEEDIALANTALDLIGQTQLWLGLAAEVEAKGRSADDLAYLRDAWDFRNALLVERPNGDFGKTLMRQFLFDAWQSLMLRGLAKSSDQRIADIAEKASKEVAYHLERSSSTVVSLGDGTAESRQRMQDALDDIYPYVGELFVTDAVDDALEKSAISPNSSVLRGEFDALVGHVITNATLKLPENAFVHKGGKTGTHTEHLGYILADMQFLQRAYPGAEW